MPPSKTKTSPALEMARQVANDDTMRTYREMLSVGTAEADIYLRNEIALSLETTLEHLRVESQREIDTRIRRERENMKSRYEIKDKLATSLRYIGGFALAGAILFYLVTGVGGCMSREAEAQRTLSADLAKSGYVNVLQPKVNAELAGDVKGATLIGVAHLKENRNYYVRTVDVTVRLPQGEPPTDTYLITYNFKDENGVATVNGDVKATRKGDILRATITMPQDDMSDDDVNFVYLTLARVREATVFESPRESVDNTTGARR